MNKEIGKKWFADSASIIAAIGASLCCTGPFVLVALGFGAAAGAVSAFFAPLRPYLLTVAFGIVGMRLVSLYRRPAALACPAEDGATCPTEGRRREKALTWGVLGLVVFFAASPYLLAALPANAPQSERAAIAADAETADIRLAINGMTCSACASHIENALRRTPGVKAANVNYADAEARIVVDYPASVDRAALLAAVASAGYQAVEK